MHTLHVNNGVYVLLMYALLVTGVLLERHCLISEHSLPRGIHGVQARDSSSRQRSLIDQYLTLCRVVANTHQV